MFWVFGGAIKRVRGCSNLQLSPQLGRGIDGLACGTDMLLAKSRLFSSTQ